MEDDDTSVTKSTIPTVAMLTVFTEESAENVNLELEVVDQYGNIVMPKSDADGSVIPGALFDDKALKYALDENNECRKHPDKSVHDI